MPPVALGTNRHQDHLTRPGQSRQPFYGCHQFHAIVGGFRFSTLEKFKIHQLEVKQLAKVDAKTMEVVGEEKSEREEEKGRVAKVVEPGWEV